MTLNFVERCGILFISHLDSREENVDLQADHKYQIHHILEKGKTHQ